ncbi:HlyD family type I secretion periplasmic adaptor subunit [Pseudophaeobacter leonis]|uniref:HlyD family type I secretion periplasmic adaptor subunit n=1 Tax=Pseudophaeobacter leonis TaxID=1144477 RepID=UPI0009F2DEE2|nr:HlyD family type I secretion periplasmic adaptor subunit [Pseudophaeobacter leonis]
MTAGAPSEALVNRQDTADLARTDLKDRVLRHAIRNCILLIALCFGGLGWWLYSARLDSAAVAPGILENASSTKLVQHLEGGIVAEFFVRDGQSVEQGDLLLRLDPTRSEATVDLFNVQLLGAQAKQTRLAAEVDLSAELLFPAVLIESASQHPKIGKLLKDEARQFELARTSLEQTRELFRTQIQQAHAEIEGLELRADVARRALVLVEEDLKAQMILLERGLTSQPKVTAMLRDKFGLEEKIAQSAIDIARTNQAISGLQLQIRQSTETYRQMAAEELDVVSRDIRSLERDLIVTRDSLKRVEVRATVSGTVQESILGTIGAIIRPGETIMRIAPSSTDYIVSAKINPNDIENILPGILAQITFPAFQSIEMQPAEGKLVAVSRDRIVDVASGENYYEAEVHILAETVPEEIETRLVAGMSVAVILPTGKRTALEYVLTPVLRRWRSAMREE